MPPRYNVMVGIGSVWRAEAAASIAAACFVTAAAAADRAPASSVTRPNSGFISDRLQPDADTNHARCVTCSVEVSNKIRAYCLARPQRFGGLIYCLTHQRRLHGPVTGTFLTWVGANQGSRNRSYLRNQR